MLVTALFIEAKKATKYYIFVGIWFKYFNRGLKLGRLAT